MLHRGFPLPKNPTYQSNTKMPFSTIFYFLFPPVLSTILSRKNPPEYKNQIWNFSNLAKKEKISQLDWESKNTSTWFASNQNNEKQNNHVPQKNKTTKKKKKKYIIPILVLKQKNKTHSS